MPKEELARIEEELDEFQLIARMRCAESLDERLGKLHYGDGRKNATDQQNGCHRVLEQYFNAYWLVLRNVLQLKLKSRLDSLSEHERKFQLQQWESEGIGSDEYRIAGYYEGYRSREVIEAEIAQCRSEILDILWSVRDGLPAWNHDKGSPLWPVLSSERERHPAPSPQAEAAVQIAHSRSRKRKGNGGSYVQMLLGHITTLRASSSDVGWQDVAARIQLGQSERLGDAALLPRSFQKRIRDTRFAGSLLDLIRLEDGKRTTEIRQGANGKKIIDFKRRFIHSLSDANGAYERRPSNPGFQQDSC